MGVMRVALFGAGGKMGCRISDNLARRREFAVDHVEPSLSGIQRLAERGIEPVPPHDALATADAVVLAVPDRLIGRISAGLVPRLRPGTLLVGLDPAAAYAEVMPMRDDVAYFVAHPCHPPLFNSETDPKAMTDWFGGVHAAQHIVCALHHGSELDYLRGERLATAMYAPVIESHRVTVEQMAILEPAVVETFAATVIGAIEELMQEAIRMGVPERAAREFTLGHIRTELAIIFGYAEFPFSDGAKLAMERARERIFLPNWKENVMSLEQIRASVREITRDDEPI